VNQRRAWPLSRNYWSRFKSWQLDLKIREATLLLSEVGFSRLQPMLCAGVVIYGSSNLGWEIVFAGHLLEQEYPKGSACF
jgi:hypothetical protein